MNVKMRFLENTSSLMLEILGVSCLVYGKDNFHVSLQQDFYMKIMVFILFTWIM